jgi:chromatin remodeling complex protein RSC6
MTDTLALIKQLHLRKKNIQDVINELVEKKYYIEEQIDKLVLPLPSNTEKQKLRSNTTRVSSKFCTPTKISNELAKFLGSEIGTKMTRIDVTREINKYIRVNNLQDKQNKRNINPDTNISKLFRLKNGDELTYFNIQKYISPHLNTIT